MVVIDDRARDGRLWIVTAYAAYTAHKLQGAPMKGKRTFHDDREGDILHIDQFMPYADQGSEGISENVIVRLDPTTAEIENPEIHGDSAQLERGALLELPIVAERRLAI